MGFMNLLMKDGNVRFWVVAVPCIGCPLTLGLIGIIMNQPLMIAGCFFWAGFGLFALLVNRRNNNLKPAEEWLILERNRIKIGKNKTPNG